MKIQQHLNELAQRPAAGASEEHVETLNETYDRAVIGLANTRAASLAELCDKLDGLILAMEVTDRFKPLMRSIRYDANRLAA